MRTVLYIVAATLFAVSAAHGAIIVTFDDPVQSGLEGDTLAFTGSIENTGAGMVFLNADDIDIAAADLFVNDLFFENVPLSLDPGETDSGIELFDVTLEPRAATGRYTADYTLFGGVDGNAQDFLATSGFELTVQSPEPGTSLLAGGAFLCISALLRRRKKT